MDKMRDMKGMEEEDKASLLQGEREKEGLDALVLVSEMIQEREYTSMSKFFNDMFSLYASKVKQEIIPDSVEPSYAGLHLGEKYEEQDFLRLIEDFHQGQMLHAKYALKIIENATELFKNYSNIAYCNVKKMHSELLGFVIVGDLHGSFKDLYYIIKRFGIPGQHYRFVFNGDFVDRGPQQCEVLLTILYAYLLYPTRVFLNRGNHEDLSLNLNKHFMPNFKVDTEVKYNQYGLAVFNRSQELFRNLPLGTIIENTVGFKCFVTHGGISDRMELKKIASRNLKRSDFDVIKIKHGEGEEVKKASQLLSDLLWSDPIPNSDVKSKALGTRPNTNRGIGCLFDEKVSEKFCQANGFNAIVRSHEVRQNGFTQDHPFCFTIFSVSNYCNGSNKGAVFFLAEKEGRIDFHDYQVEETNEKIRNENRSMILTTFKTFLERESSALVKLFRDADANNKGYLKLEKWASILARFVSKKLSEIDAKHFISLKDYLCPCDGDYAIYSRMFPNRANNANPAVVEYLETVFNFVDLDRSGSISENEAKNLIRTMNKSLNTNYSTKFIQKMDLDKNGSIDLNEFKTSFLKAFNLQ